MEGQGVIALEGKHERGAEVDKVATQAGEDDVVMADDGVHVLV